MPQSLSKILIHIVFSTKNREPFLTDPLIRREMHAYLATVFNELDSRALIVGGVEDHVHILCDLSRNHSVAEVVREAKRNSSKWVKSRVRTLRLFR